MSWTEFAGKGLEVADKHIGSLKLPSFAAMVVGAAVYIWYSDIANVPLLRELLIIPKSYLGLGVLALFILNLAWLPSALGAWSKRRKNARSEIRKFERHRDLVAKLENRESRAVLAYMYFTKTADVWLYEEEFLRVRELQTKGFVYIERRRDMVNVIANVDALFDVVEPHISVLLPAGETDIPGFVTAYERELRSDRQGRYVRHFPTLINYTLVPEELKQLEED